MKRTILTMMMMCAMLIGFAQQRQLPMSEYVVSDLLQAEMTESQIEQMRANDPAGLMRMNYTIVNAATVTYKLWDGNLQMMGTLEQYLPKGMTYDEESIIQAGCVNMYKWNLPQEEYRYNVFKLRRSGVYVVVLPKSVLEERVQAHIHSYKF
ncbi:MAG: hypothetical protein IKO09_06450 [Bacteroidales bacterium]|jgi:hypothetical protein|nr:hypothetical protein [Bacteroidales bacterium]